MGLISRFGKSTAYTALHSKDIFQIISKYANYVTIFRVDIYNFFIWDYISSFAATQLTYSQINKERVDLVFNWNLFIWDVNVCITLRYPYNIA